MKVMITGATKGIGYAILKMLKNDGHVCTVIARSVDTFEHSKLENVEYIKCDLSDHLKLLHLCGNLGQYDCLINNAGCGRPIKFNLISFDDIQYEFNLNYAAPLFLIQALLPSMIKRRFGRIINISSTASKTGVPYLFNYSASKAALNSLGQSLSKCIDTPNVTINTICPGGIDTEMSVSGRSEISQLHGMDSEDYQRRMVESMHLGRLIEPSEVAFMVRYLISDESACITGQSFNICGSMEVH